MKITMEENLNTSCKNQEGNEMIHNNEHKVGIRNKGPCKKQQPGYKRSSVNQ